MQDHKFLKLDPRNFHNKCDIFVFEHLTQLFKSYQHSYFRVKSFD